MQALQIAASGLRVAEHSLDRIAHNLANMQTLGFKRLAPQFVELISRMEPSESVDVARPRTLTASGARVTDTITDFADGPLLPTGAALDVAIQGSGFLEVEQKDGGYAYTRLGQLKVDAEGRLALRTGELLTANIVIPPDVEKVEIAPDGRVQGLAGGSSERQELGQLMLSRVADPAALRPIGDGFYEVTESSGEAMTYEPGVEGAGTFLSAFLEGSNVQIAPQMAQLLIAQRAYQVNARVIQSADLLFETSLNLLRR